MYVSPPVGIAKPTNPLLAMLRFRPARGVGKGSFFSLTKQAGVAMKKWWMAAPVATIGVAVWAAVPASADEAGYIDYLQNDTYLVSKYSSQQLLAEGYKVCDAISRGAKDLQAVNMVKRDLSVSDGAAIDVYSAATVMLGC
jgi:hypothetical protein